QRAEDYLFQLHVLRTLLFLGIGASALEFVSTTSSVRAFSESVHFEWRFAPLALLAVAVIALTVIGLAIIRFSQALAFSRPERVLILFSRVLLVLGRVVGPVALPLRRALDGLLRFVKLPIPLERDTIRSADEIS